MVKKGIEGGKSKLYVKGGMSAMVGVRVLKEADGILVSVCVFVAGWLVAPGFLMDLYKSTSVV